jgi:hypothetical protein
MKKRTLLNLALFVLLATSMTVDSVQAQLELGSSGVLARVGIDPLVVIMAPTGNDSNDGLTINTAILTLARAQEVIRKEIEKRGARNVRVRIGPGKYFNQTVVWNFVMPSHHITFEPLSDDKVRPVFDGTNQGGTWFLLNYAGGTNSNLHFRYIRVENYQTAISFTGNRNNQANSNGGNSLYGMYFRNIGNISAPHLEGSTAAVRLQNSDNNRIENSHFVNIVNVSGCGKLHALYIAHMSDDNLIQGNRIVNNCGDPIKLRDYSNRNMIFGNVIMDSGVKAAYADSYCDHDTRPVCCSSNPDAPGCSFEEGLCCTKPDPECPSWDNQFRNNTIGKNATGGFLKFFHYYQDDNANGCSRPSSSSVRLRTSDNRRS